MPGLVKLLGALIILFGVLVLINSDYLKKVIDYCKQGKRLAWTAFSKVVVGVILLLSASQCRVPFIINILGIVSILGPVVFLAMGTEKIDKYLDWWETRPATLYKVYSLVTIALGFILIYSA